VASKRELIAPKGSKRYVRRDASGEFRKEVSRLLAADRQSKAKTIAKKGQGDRGDAPHARRAVRSRRRRRAR
jgi:hypothetical protein